jgi:hypothetical protein
MSLMSKLITAAAFATAVAAPASAQSDDPSVGSGNIARQMGNDGPLSAFARQSPSQFERRHIPHAVPFTAADKALFDRIGVE